MKKSVMVVVVVLAWATAGFAEYKAVSPKKKLPDGAIAVTQPGSYAEAGKTYVLMNNISGEMTPIFLGKDVTLDLNGHTITFAKGKYEHVPNHGFEDGLKGWDTSKAPNAKVVSKTFLPLVGEKILELPVGEEIISPYVTLPVANRSYYAVVSCGRDQRISIYVDDEKGNPVKTIFQTKQANMGCPVENVDTVYGGGAIFAHLHNLPAGKYRVRVKALQSKKNNACWLDEIDILPAFDSGIAVVGAIKPYANYTAMRKWHPYAFFDFNKNSAAGAKGQKTSYEPLETIPHVKGSGTITIKNGIIKNGAELVRSWAIHSNAKDVKLVLENIKVINAGLNANAVRAPASRVMHCRFEVDTPTIINRHDTSAMNVDISNAEEVAHNEFIGGQGNLSYRGEGANIHHNLFVNAQTVTNHYSISPGSNSKIHNNRFEPKSGSGIYIGRSHDVELFDNIFKIEAAEPNFEYRYGRYSTSAVRLSDYNAKPGSKKGVCANNRVYRNKIHVKAKAYPEYKGCKPRAYAFFISVGGGTNYIYENEIVVENNETDPNVKAYAFFIGCSDNGGEIYQNKVTTNCSAAWIGNEYGNGKNTKFYNNTFIRAKNTLPKFKAFVMGDGGNSAENIGFFSNKFQGWKDLFSHHTRSLSYSMGWTLTVKLTGKDGNPIKERQILIRDKDGKEVVKLNTNEGGTIKAMLPEYVATAKGKKVCSTYTVSTGKIEMNEIQRQIQLTKDMTVELKEK